MKKGPALIEPVQGISVDYAAPTFHWKLVPEADNYRIELSKDTSFDEPSHSLEVGKSNLLTIYNLFPRESGDLYWRVQAKTAQGWTDWSEAGSFKIITEARRAAKAKPAPVRSAARPAATQAPAPRAQPARVPVAPAAPSQATTPQPAVAAPPVSPPRVAYTDHVNTLAKFATIWVVVTLLVTVFLVGKVLLSG